MTGRLGEFFFDRMNWIYRMGERAHEEHEEGFLNRRSQREQRGIWDDGDYS
jgi:hypothetical protein